MNQKPATEAGPHRMKNLGRKNGLMTFKCLVLYLCITVGNKGSTTFFAKSFNRLSILPDLSSNLFASEHQGKDLAIPLGTIKHPLSEKCMV